MHPRERLISILNWFWQNQLAAKVISGACKTISNSWNPKRPVFKHYSKFDEKKKRILNSYKSWKFYVYCDVDFKGFYLRSRPFNNIHPQLRQIYDTSPNTQALECKTFISSFSITIKYCVPHKQSRVVRYIGRLKAQFCSLRKQGNDLSAEKKSLVGGRSK